MKCFMFYVLSYLSARYVLLADDEMTKVVDFGMARKTYYEGNYNNQGR